MSPLNEKQEQFCQNYVLHRNATKAALSAGYSKTSAHNQGHRLLQDERVKERVKELTDGIATDVDVISEIEKQYEVAKNAGHSNSALKALELLAKVRGSNVEESTLDSDTLENEIVNSLHVMGFEKAFELFEKAFPEQFDEAESLPSEELTSTTDTEAGSNDDT